jgi:hypothetical protein
LDSLSKHAQVPNRFFATAPVCSPARTSLITDIKTYNIGTGHHRSKYNVPSFVKHFTALLRKEGCYCSNNEKTDYNVGNLIQFTNQAWDESYDCVRSVVKDNLCCSRNFMSYQPQMRYLNYIDTGPMSKEIRKDGRSDKLNPLQKSILTPRPVEFLYDYVNDPRCTKNLIDNPKYLKTIKQLSDTLYLHMIESKDVMLIPEFEMQKIDQKTTLYDFSASASNYPIKDVVNAAWLSGQIGKNSIEKQINLLNSKVPTISYWAAIGLKSQPLASLEKYKKQMSDFLTSKSSSAITPVIASVFYDFDANKNAFLKLEEICLSEDTYLSWLAFQMMIYSKRKKDYLPIIQKYQEKEKGRKGFEMANTSSQMLEYAIKLETK